MEAVVSGYLAVPANGPESGPGIIVLQEWWGLVEHIKRTCDRFADVGFTALAPDLYHGTTVPLTEPDEAGQADDGPEDGNGGQGPERGGRRADPADRPAVRSG